MCDAAPTVQFDELGPMTKLGEGEFCIASSSSLWGSPVAVKMLKPVKAKEAMARSDLSRETQLLARMRHENIISVIAHGVYKSPHAVDELSFICLEVLATTLASELPPSNSNSSPWVRKAAVKAWPVQRALQVGVQIARAMEYCHDLWMPGYRLLHRDLKPNNVGFTASGRVVLFDFGLCKLWANRADEAHANDLRKLTGLTGSLRYMAPEVALCQPYNHKAEVFSFASLLFEMLAHQKPFYWMTPDDFMRDVCQGGRRCKIPKGTPDGVADLLNVCWEQDSAKRPEFRDIVRSLEVILAQLPEYTYVRPGGSRPASAPMRRTSSCNAATTTTETRPSSADSPPARRPKKPGSFFGRLFS